MLVYLGPAGRAGWWECAQVAPGDFQDLESYLQVAACGFWGLRTRYVTRHTLVACCVFHGMLRTKQSHANRVLERPAP